MPHKSKEQMRAMRQKYGLGEYKKKGPKSSPHAARKSVPSVAYNYVKGNRKSGAKGPRRRGRNSGSRNQFGEVALAGLPGIADSAIGSSGYSPFGSFQRPTAYQAPSRQSIEGQPLPDGNRGNNQLRGL